MTFISKFLLLDLPLHEVTEGQWRDASGHDHHATPNPFCEPDRIEKLGSCLRLDAGGQLSLEDGQLTGSEGQPFTGNEDALTVEFWALPADATKAARQILDGPVNVWMGAGKIQWSFGGDLPRRVSIPSEPAEPAEAGVDIPHHWAIVVDRRNAQSPPHTVYRDSVELDDEDEDEVEDIPTADGTAELVIGGDGDNGWTGRLAHLRIWGAPLTQAQLEKCMQRDLTAHAGFKATTSIDWQLLNADDEPTLYIHSSRARQVLRFSVENGSDAPLIIPRESKEKKASYQNRHFKLAFRPGTLKKGVLAEKHLETMMSENPGWHIGADQWQGQDCVFFLWTGTDDEPGDKTLNPGTALEIVLPGLAAAPGAGSRTTRVLLKYRGLKLRAGVNQADLDGHRGQVLNIISRDPLVPYRKPPFEVGVVGAPAILNNGTETCLTLYIKNLNRDEDGKAARILLGLASVAEDRAAKFVLEIDVWQPGKPDSQGLGECDDLTGTEVTCVSGNASIAEDERGPGIVSWKIKPEPVNGTEKFGIEKDDTVIMTLAGLKTAAPPGRSVLRLRYEDFDDYGEGVFEIPVDRVPAVPARLMQGGAGYGLAIGHDPRVGHTDPTPDPKVDPTVEVLDEVLSVKQVGNGDAVRIENAGGGAGLTVVQNGTGPVARFTGTLAIEGSEPKQHATIHIQPGSWSGQHAGNATIDLGDRYHGITAEWGKGTTLHDVNGLALSVGPAKPVPHPWEGTSGAITLSAGGQKRLTVNKDGNVGIGTTDAEGNLHVHGEVRSSGRLKDKTGEVMPVGTVVTYAGTKAPDGWLMCRGQRVSDPKYEDLAKVLGHSGVPFNVPNYNGRFIAGAYGSGEYGLSKTGGEAFVKLTVAQMPTHGHTVHDPGHVHQYTQTTAAHYNKNSGDTRKTFHWYPQQTSRSRTGISLRNTGRSAPHENRPPFVALNYIIKY